MYAPLFSSLNLIICRVLRTFWKKILHNVFWVGFYAISLSSKHNSCPYRAERMATWYNEKDLPLSINLIFFFDTPLLFAASERDIFFWVLNKQSSRPIMRRLKKSLSAVFLVGFIFQLLFVKLKTKPAFKLGRRSSKTVEVQSPLFNILPALRLFRRRILLLRRCFWGTVGYL